MGEVITALFGFVGGGWGRIGEVITAAFGFFLLFGVGGGYCRYTFLFKEGVVTVLKRKRQSLWGQNLWGHC